MGLLWMECASIAVMLAHIALCPYTKVEESFNMQAIHDVLYFTANISQYDHLEFPGVVPRTFIGPGLVALTASPYVGLVRLINIEKIWAQYIVRGILGFTVLMSLFTYCNAVRDRCGDKTAQYTLLLTLSQFHFMFYMSRTLPNVFALVLVLLAIAAWIQQSHYRFLWLSGATILVFRFELSLYLGLLLLMDIVYRRISITTVIKIALPAGVILLGLTLFVDSFFWRRYVWPEGEVLWYNTVMNKSSNWGTSPFLWYFYSALPRALSFSLFMVPMGLLLMPPLRHLVLPALVFVFLYSFLPHKELRFIIYVIPVCNTAAAAAMNRLWINRHKHFLGKLLAYIAMLHVVGNLCTSGVFMYTSCHNYPGGEAIYRLHQLEPSNNEVHVHIDVPTAQTGVTRFGQMNPKWIYNKTEDLSPDGAEMMSFTHLLLGTPEDLTYYKNTHNVLEKISGFDGITFNRHEFPFIHFKHSTKIWILKRK